MGRFVTGQGHSQGRYFGGCHLLDSIHTGLLFWRVGWNRTDHATPCKRRNAIGSNIELEHVQRNRFGQSRDTQLGGRIIGLTKVTHQAGSRSHVDVVATFLFLEIRGCSTTDVKAAIQMHFHHRIPFVNAHFVEKPVAQNTSVIDHHINAAIIFHRHLNNASSAQGVGDTVGVGNGFAA